MSALDELSSSARTVLSALADSVVSIGRDGRGSGVVVAAGKVLTNAHNLRDGSTSVTFADGRSVQGTVSGVDGDGDLVVLDVDTGSAVSAVLASEAPALGDVVFAVGRGGHRTRVSFGMVASVDVAFEGPRGRRIAGGVEHTAPLARGSSGGPLADASGRVLGLNTHRTGGGFYVARPIDEALRARLDGLVAGQSFERPRLGVALAPPAVAAKLRASVGLPPREGLLVRGVEPDQPAAAAGIAAGDLLVEAGGVALDSIEALGDALVAGAGAGAIVIKVVRGTDERVVAVSYGSGEAPTE